MEKCFFSGWPDEDAAWDSCQASATGNTSFLVPEVIPPGGAASLPSDGYPSNCHPPWWTPHEGAADDGGASASRSSHSEAEKRRRERINGQLAKLRKLIPKSEKMDKAALLGSALEHVKELKRKAMELSKFITIPTDVDELTINYLNDQENAICKSKEQIFIEVSFCSDDRPELFSDLNRALKGLKLVTVQADMTSLAGRIKCMFVLCATDGMEETAKQSLKVVLSRIIVSSSSSNCRMRSKRQRFFLQSD